MKRISIFFHLFVMSIIALFYPKAVLIFIKSAVDKAGGMEEIERMINHSKEV